MDPSVSQLDLEQLNEKDKAELRQFVGNENQRTRVRERKLPTQAKLFFSSQPAAPTPTK